MVILSLKSLPLTRTLNLMPMTRFLLSILLACFVQNIALSQSPLTQYFDGADTLPNQSLFITIDTAAGNIWQIGQPQKVLFDNAFTQPNVIVTDTLNTYPVNNVSSFSYKVNSWQWPFGILAIQWMQKLNMDYDHDGGIIEYSANNGATWTNAFNDPYVYNFYGFDPANADTLSGGEYAFSGTDNIWRNIWLCFDISWLSSQDTLIIRHTFKSDSVDTGKEGWMIDNYWVAPTIIHTIGETEQKDYLKVFPNITDGVVNIQAKKIDAYHIIEKLEVLNSAGQVIQSFANVPTRFYIDIKDHPPGSYFVRVKTNIDSGTFPVILSGNRK